MNDIPFIARVEFGEHYTIANELDHIANEFFEIAIRGQYWTLREDGTIVSKKVDESLPVIMFTIDLSDSDTTITCNLLPRHFSDEIEKRHYLKEAMRINVIAETDDESIFDFFENQDAIICEVGHSWYLKSARELHSMLAVFEPFPKR